LSDAQREQLSGFPAELDDEALDRFFTLSGAEVTEARQRRGEGNRLGWSLLLCGLRMLGFCPDDVTTAPAVAVRFVARQLGVDPEVLTGYGKRAQTRTDHVNQVKAFLGFRSATAADLAEVRDWLAAEALVVDRPVVLFRLVCARLHELRLVRPGLTVIEQSLVGAAREAARRETAARVAGLCTSDRCRVLDGLLEVDPDLEVATATWLRRFAVQACPRDIHEEIDKLVFLRELDAGDWDLGVLPAQRVTTLARWVQAASNQALAQSSPQRRYPALLAFAAQRLVEVTDELVDLFDKLLGDTNAKARRRLGEYQQSIAAAANNKVLLLAVLARVLLDPDLADADRLEILFEAVPRDRLAAALVDCERIARPADNSHLDLLGDHYSRLRQCVPRLLEVLTFRSHRDADELLAGIEVLRELNRTGRRKVPRDAPLTFVPKAWMPLVGSGPDKVSRRFWELALLWRLRDGLRSGDVWVAGSRRYADPETYLLDETSWAGMRSDYCAAVGRPASGRERIAQLDRELDEELASFADMLARGESPVRMDGDRLVVGRDTGDDLPPSVTQLKALIGEVFPQVELSEVVITIDSICGFSRHLLHAAGTKSRSPAMLIHLYAAILAQATNLGPVAMARASGLSYDQVAHATAWYLREETLTPAIDEVINYHHRLPATRAWGDGTFASSDGQRFPVQVKAANAGALPRYFGFGRGLSVLTSVTDHYATFGTKVVPTRVREGLFALDEIFALAERDSELAITEHTTDTAGFTDLLFGAYDVVGLGFCPRIRDLRRPTPVAARPGHPTAAGSAVSGQSGHRDPDPGSLGRLAPPRRLNPRRSGAAVADTDQAPSLPPAKRPGPSAGRARPSGQNPVHPALPATPRDAQTGRSPAEQGREPQRPAGNGALRPPGQSPPSPAHRPDRPGPVHHPGGQLHRRVQCRAAAPGRAPAPRGRLPDRRRRRLPRRTDDVRTHPGPRPLPLRSQPPTPGAPAGAVASA
jgi:TnpA family transposase